MNRKYAVNIADAARKLGCRTNVIYFRLHSGWSLESATTQPVSQRLQKKELSDKEVYGGGKQYKSYDDSCMRNEKIYADDFPECKKHNKNEYYSVGGWKIIYLNYVKKGEYRFQAVNTDGRSYATNDPIEIQSILEEIFCNVCK